MVSVNIEKWMETGFSVIESINSRQHNFAFIYWVTKFLNWKKNWIEFIHVDYLHMDKYKQSCVVYCRLPSHVAIYWLPKCGQYCHTITK